MMYIGSLMVALAVEESGLHRRIALRALSLAVRKSNQMNEPGCSEDSVGFIKIAVAGLALSKCLYKEQDNEELFNHIFMIFHTLV